MSAKEYDVSSIITATHLQNSYPDLSARSLYGLSCFISTQGSCIYQRVVRNRFVHQTRWSHQKSRNRRRNHMRPRSKRCTRPPGVQQALQLLRSDRSRRQSMRIGRMTTQWPSQTSSQLLPEAYPLHHSRTLHSSIPIMRSSGMRMMSRIPKTGRSGGRHILSSLARLQVVRCKSLDEYVCG